MLDMTRIDSTFLPEWLRRLGVAGFCFFLAKGLLWLALPTIAAGLFR